MKFTELEGMEESTATVVGAIPAYDFHSVDGVFIKKIPLKKGLMVPQHAHLHSHCTIIGKGLLRVWQETRYLGTKGAGVILEIPAGVMHTFYALEDSEIYCVHNEEHALVIAQNTLESS